MASVPNATDIGDLSVLSVSAATKTVLDAKYTDAMAWATWAAQLLEKNIVDTSNLLVNRTIDADLDQLTADLIPYLDPPAVDEYTQGQQFAEELVDTLRNKLRLMLTNPGTGLGDAAEAAIFARDQARITAERAIVYSEVVNQFNSFPAPPGALIAKLTEIQNETSTRLADSSAEILKLSAQLQQDTNKHTDTATLQFIATVAEIFNSAELRRLEAYKATVAVSLDGYKASLALLTSRAEILIKKAELDIEAKAKQLAIDLEVLKGLAQAAAQMVASALNSVNVSSSLGFSGSINDSTSTSESVQHIFEGV